MRTAHLSRDVCLLCLREASSCHSKPCESFVLLLLSHSCHITLASPFSLLLMGCSVCRTSNLVSEAYRKCSFFDANELCDVFSITVYKTLWQDRMLTCWNGNLKLKLTSIPLIKWQLQCLFFFLTKCSVDLTLTIHKSMFALLILGINDTYYRPITDVGAGWVLKVFKGL